MTEWQELGEVQDNTVWDNSVSSWKDILHKYSDTAIQTIADGGMKLWDALADDRRQRAAQEILFNRNVDTLVDNEKLWL
jgi:predicted kinase